MAKFVIEGGVPLYGKVKIAGNKNAVLPCMAATILTKEECVLKNVPQISDVLVLARIMKKIGAEIDGLGTPTLRISCKGVNSTKIDSKLVSQLRASILLCGPLLARFGEVSFGHPGGDVIGKRSVQTHLAALGNFGFAFSEENWLSYTSKKNSKTRLTEVYLEEASVTATENVLLLASNFSERTTIKNAACEPHVASLCEMLVKMGAKIDGIGSNLLIVEGNKELGGATHTIPSDNIEVGTFAIASAVTSGEVEIESVQKEDLDPIIYFLSKIGLKMRFEKGSLFVYPSKLKAIPKVTTGIWPAFPTDLMSCMIVLATQSDGVTLLHDWMYESRMFFVDKLISMGAHVTIADPHRVLVYGPTKLKGQALDTPDLRAGMALIVASLAAEGESIIDKVELVERGYEKIEQKLITLGAKIKRVH